MFNLFRRQLTAAVYYFLQTFFTESRSPFYFAKVRKNNISDSPYHAIRIYGNDHVIEYNEIYDVINEHFRNAQNDKEAGFALPNMYIDYVTEKNNLFML